ncbi:MAG TPA: PEGA domain-containing protein [Terriglobia bacterium]|nr:PEGA domain-containing protein [Terriglobia bacterium]HKT11386.1 PEGA domain-containing protein [Terriglobia bacterium]
MSWSCRRVGILTLGACLVLLLSFLNAAAQEANSGYLKVKSNPGRAGVFVDGNYLGPAKNFGETRKYAVSPGEHEVKLSDSLFKDYATTVTIQSGKTTTIAPKLEALPAPAPPFGTLRIQGSDKFAAVYLNDKFMGHMDEFNNHWQGLRIKPGEYELKVVPAQGGQPFEQKVTITENTTARVKVQ